MLRVIIGHQIVYQEKKIVVFVSLCVLLAITYSVDLFLSQWISDVRNEGCGCILKG